MDRGKELAKNTLILSFGTFLPKFAALITIPIITAHLTKIEYGTYDLLTTLVSLLLPVVTLQIHSGAFRFLIDCRDNPTEKKRVISNIYLFLVPISVITLIILYLLLGKVETSSRILVVIYFFVDIIIITTQQVVRGLSKNGLYSTSVVMQSVINTVLIVILVGITDNGLNGVLISFIVATACGIFLLMFKGGILRELDFSFRSSKTIKQLLAYSWPMVPNTLSNWVLSVSDRFVLTAFMGLEAVAIYAAANKIPQLFTSVQGTFVFAWQENASLALSDNDVEKYYSDIYDRIFCILSGIMAALIGATPFLFLALVRGDYANAYPHMPILFMGIFFSAISSFMGGIYVAHKRTKNVGITTMLAAACNLLIDFALVKSVGIYAASISTLVSYTLLAIYRMYDVKKFQPISYNIKKIVFSLVVLVGMCVVCWINDFALNIVNLAIGITFAFVLNRKLIRNILRSLKHRFIKAANLL